MFFLTGYCPADSLLSFLTCHSRLPYPLPLYCLASLVQYHLIDLSIRICNELNLCINHLEEELRFGLGKDLKLP